MFQKNDEGKKNNDSNIKTSKGTNCLNSKLKIQKTC